MERCGNCKYWNIDEDKEGWGVCERGTSEDGFPKDKSTKIYGADHEGYHAWIISKEDFYCCQWRLRSRYEEIL